MVYRTKQSHLLPCQDLNLVPHSQSVVCCLNTSGQNTVSTHYCYYDETYIHY